MKIFGQPADYSDMLQRIFYMTVASGFFCTILLAKASPTFQELINSISTQADIGPIKNIKVLYVLIPFIIGAISRILKLHDRISDVFKIRLRFDTRFILFPLAQDAKIELTEDLKKKIKQNRVAVMYKVFYEYAGFKSPVIDEQLVRTAADNWGWFWVFVESSIIFFVTAVLLVFLNKWYYVLFCICIILGEMIFMIFQWSACKRCARRQIDAILSDCNRKDKIAAHFQSL